MEIKNSKNPHSNTLSGEKAARLITVQNSNPNQINQAINRLLKIEVEL